MTQEIEKYNVRTKAHKRKLIKRWLIAIVVLAIIIWAFAGVPSLELKSKSLEILKSIFSGLFHPDISYIYIPDGEDLLRGLLCDSRCRYFHRRNYLYSISISRCK